MPKALSFFFTFSLFMFSSASAQESGALSDPHDVYMVLSVGARNMTGSN
jgi:hypothetical protein